MIVFFLFLYNIINLYNDDLKNNIENGLDMIKELLSCPKTPGVYIFSNKNEYYTLESKKFI